MSTDMLRRLTNCRLLLLLLLLLLLPIGLHFETIMTWTELRISQKFAVAKPELVSKRSTGAMNIMNGSVGVGSPPVWLLTTSRPTAHARRNPWHIHPPAEIMIRTTGFSSYRPTSSLLKSRPALLPPPSLTTLSKALVYVHWRCIQIAK